MSRVVVVLGLLLASPALAGPPVRPAYGPGGRANTHSGFPGEDSAAAAHRELDELRALVRTVRDPNLQRALDVSVTRLLQDLRNLDADRWDLIDRAALLEAEAISCATQLRDARQPRYQVYVQPERYPPPPPVVVEPAGPVVASPAEVLRIQRAMEDASFASDKIEVLRSAAADRWFTVGQVQQLMGAVTFGKDKVEVAALLFEAVVDPENWFEVYSALTFESDKRELRRRVGK